MSNGLRGTEEGQETKTRVAGPMEAVEAMKAMRTSA